MVYILSPGHSSAHHGLSMLLMDDYSWCMIFQLETWEGGCSLMNLKICTGAKIMPSSFVCAFCRILCSLYKSPCSVYKNSIFILQKTSWNWYTAYFLLCSLCIKPQGIPVSHYKSPILLMRLVMRRTIWFNEQSPDPPYKIFEYVELRKWIQNSSWTYNTFPSFNSVINQGVLVF